MVLRLLVVTVISGWSAGLLAGQSIVIDKEASFVVAHAKATGHTFDAIPETYVCELELNEGRNEVDKVLFRFDFANLKTGDTKRDKEMLHWLEVETFPALEFRATGWVEKNGQSILQGQLSFHGEDKPVDIVMEVRRDGDQIDLKGFMPLNTSDYNLKPIRKMLFLKVNPNLRVEFHLVGKVTAMHRGGQ